MPHPEIDEMQKRIHTLTSLTHQCWDKCIMVKGRSQLLLEERDCVIKCVFRYLDTYDRVDTKIRGEEGGVEEYYDDE